MSPKDSAKDSSAKGSSANDSQSSTPREKTREELDAVVLSLRPTFIPRGYEKLNKDVYRNIFYSTSSADSYRSPLSHSASSPGLHAGARGQHLGNLLTTGGVKYKPSRAPLYARTMCCYTAEYVPRPLDGYGINKECYDLFKEKCTTSSGSATGSGAKFKGESATTEAYIRFSRKECASAIPDNFKPEIQTHVNKNDKLLVLESTSHVDHKKPPPTKKDASFKPKYRRVKSAGTCISRSSYATDFDAKKYDKLWPVKFAHQVMPPPPTSGYTGKQRRRPDSPDKLVPEQFHIGDIVSVGLPG